MGSFVVWLFVLLLFTSTQARLQQPFSLRHVSFVENQEMSVSVLLRFEISSEKVHFEAGLCCLDTLKLSCQSREAGVWARESSHEGHSICAPSPPLAVVPIPKTKSLVATVDTQVTNL